MSLVLGIPANILNLVQQGLLERAFHDGLYPNLAYRAEALFEEWDTNTGTEIVMSRPGLLPTITQPLTPGQDPQPQVVPYEQWVATLNQFSGTVDTYMPNAATANANLFMRNVHQLGLQSGRSINTVARNNLYKPYLSGSTTLLAACLTSDTTLRVAALNGFTDVIVPGTTIRPAAVSSATPLQIKLGPTGAVLANVVGATPDNPADAFGPGTLTLSAAVGTAFAIRSAVVSAYAPTIIRSAGGASIDAISSSDTLVLQQVINAVAFMRQANVQPHEDGFFHAHVSPLANAQFFADPVFQRLNQSLPNGLVYKEGFIGTISNVMFFMNSESPQDTNTGTQTATGLLGVYGQDIGAEVVNGTGVRIGRVIITGKGCLYEKGLDESNYVSEAGITGKIGEFDVINNGLQILTERIRLVMRAPLDRLQQTVSTSWSISTSFTAPSDITAPSGPQRYKRAIVLEHAL